MTIASRWNYYRRIIPAYFGPGRSQLTFWHETPEINRHATNTKLGSYYMTFREKADYAGPYDIAGVPMLEYHGKIGLQYNPIAIAQWGLANHNIFHETRDEVRCTKMIKAAEWLVANSEQNAYGVWVWNHHFDWDYRTTLKAPWYSGLAQGQGVSLLLRAYVQTQDMRYQQTANRAFVALTLPISQGGVLYEDEEKNLWIEEYLVDPPTHILNGFIWSLWGVFDFWLTQADSTARQIFDRGVKNLLVNLSIYDTGYWSLYERSGTNLRMLTSPFYHRLHVVQLRVMAMLTGDARFTEVADRWEAYSQSRVHRTRALVEKSMFKLLHY